MPYKDPNAQQAAQRAWYNTHKELRRKHYQQANRDQRQRRKDWYVAMMNETTCAHCPENHISVLDFHHVDDNKDHGVSKLLTDKRAIDRVVSEMEKCVVVCSNCHRKHHAGIINVNQYQKYQIPANWQDIWESLWDNR